MEDTYTHKDLANLCSVSETTIKSYRRKFPGFIHVLTRGKPIRFKKEAGDVCLAIRDCFEKGMSVAETAKFLKERFKEEAAPAGRTKPAPTPSGQGGVSAEYLEQFFQTAGKMMHGMASLATAQAKSAQRLERLEAAVDALVEAETRNMELFNELLARQAEEPVMPAPRAAAPDEPAARKPEPEPEQPAEPRPEHQPAQPERVRARKIVNVRDPEGGVTSYALEKETAEPEQGVLELQEDQIIPDGPPATLLNAPIVIRNDQNEFLGVPGRLPLSGFIEVLAKETEGGSSEADWRQHNRHWVHTMAVPGGDSHELFFLPTTTPRGNHVALLDRLDVNGRLTSPHFLQEFFRQVKDKIQD
ncbi:DNA-binding protein [Pseudodesulfovibrio cashew]|uniref:DNA-binding protein n=1 Tax=Pseudodesulfovibrio cashew TaxID=2678688 RepID=A0A6I6JHA0_9BACT|nr:DNA-binding protein [Pseudodesulfovibrio cashew]QGY39457.1 DNA-binding protein [Pseudodesulfovibrio cashew]